MASKAIQSLAGDSILQKQTTDNNMLPFSPYHISINRNASQLSEKSLKLAQSPSIENSNKVYAIKKKNKQ